MIQNLCYQFSTKNIQLSGGENIFYIDEGVGQKTLLFVHGLANNALSWQQNIVHLRKKFRCLAIDLPGNGLSTVKETNFSMKYFSTVIIELIEKLQLKEVILSDNIKWALSMISN